MSSSRKFVIDTDAGLDDAQAILMALAVPDVDVIGLTTVTGNATSAQVAKNLLRLLKVADRQDIPIYRGCEDMLLGWQKPEDYIYHGKDGFGDVPDPDSPSAELIKSKHGVDALLDLTEQQPGEITLVCIGPLTNVAMAMRMDGRFGSKLKNCIIMGGNYNAEGNVTPSGEFNFYSDPEAAYIVLNHLECPITLVCWELCVQHSITWDDHIDLREVSSAKAQFLSKIEHFAVSASKAKGSQTYGLADEMAMACALDDDVITKSHDVYVSVELHGNMTRGQMVVDWHDIMGNKPNVRLVTELDKTMLKSMLLKAVGT